MKYIELNAFLKVKGIASTGGEAKNLIRNEQIKVNNVIETRNKRKLIKDDIVIYNDQNYIVEEQFLLKEK